jgi:hypothetical protein
MPRTATATEQVETMASDDPAALAASTAQGWAHALNTVARPAPEHLEAAQEALTALERADRPIQSWIGVKLTLQEALETARLRVDGGRPEITVTQLAEAVGQLRELGLVLDPQVSPEDSGWPRPPAGYAQGYVAARRRQAEAEARVAELKTELEEANERAALQDAELRRQVELRDRFERERDRVAELKTELEEANERAALQDAELRRQVELRDRFERERDQERLATQRANLARSAAVESAREDSRRAGYVWCLAQLGNSLPGYDDMSTEELRDLAAKRLQEGNLDGGTLRHVTNELVRAGRCLALGLDGPLPKLDQERPIPLAAAVVELADRTARERATAVERQRELQEALEAERGAPGPSQTRWSDILRERDSHRRRIAELEATLKVERGDDITDPESQ